MAEKYGFKYELIQYKWPRWLNQQTEKQRIMWGLVLLYLVILIDVVTSKHKARTTHTCRSCLISLACD